MTDPLQVASASDDRTPLVESLVRDNEKRARPSKYAPEVRERAVPTVFDHTPEIRRNGRDSTTRATVSRGQRVRIRLRCFCPDLRQVPSRTIGFAIDLHAKGFGPTYGDQ